MPLGILGYTYTGFGSIRIVCLKLSERVTEFIEQSGVYVPAFMETGH